jgi:RNA polymerase sigma-70 factor, ECF subfamily
MRYVDGRTVQEISDATNRPLGTITKQLSRAIQRLKKWLIEVQS